jgi:Flp pilus assembly protein TadD
VIHLEHLGAAVLLWSCVACAGSTTAASSDEPPKSTDGTASRPPRRPGGPGGSDTAGTRELDQAIKAAQANDLDAAIAQSKAAIEKNPNLEKAYLLLASSCAMKQDDTCEKDAYNQGVAALPASAALLNGRGFVRLQAGDKDNGVRDLERAVELSNRRDAKFMADLAYGYLTEARLPDAEALAQRARALDPSCLEAALTHGAIMLTKKDGKGAVDALSAASKIAPDDPSVKRQLALALSMNGQHEDALAIFEQLLAKSDTPDALLHVEAAGELMKLERAKDAQKHMESAVKIDPNDPRYWSLLLKTQEKTGDKKGAAVTKKKLAALGAKP